MDEAAGSLNVTGDAEATPRRRKKKEPKPMAISVTRHRLEKGHVHPDLVIAQALLAAHGHPVLNAEEQIGMEFGASTVEAVKAFQEAKGLAVDGVIGLHTWTALESSE